MAQSNINYLNKVLKVQSIYNEYKAIGLPNREIWKRHILPVFYISETTFYRYLGRNAKREMRLKMEKIS